MKKRLIILGLKIAILINIEWVEISYDKTFCSAFKIVHFREISIAHRFRNYFQEFFNYAVFIDIAKV